MKYLIIGDPHITLSSLEESKKFFEYAVQVCLDNNITNVIILGDCQHNHALMRLEVVSLWTIIFDSFEQNNITCYSIVGNHDVSGDKSKERIETALDAFKDKTNVIIGKQVRGNIGFISYTSDEQLFYKEAQELYESGAKILFCHQTFNGAQYENGMYAPNGFDPNKVPQKNIISGHIHKKQQFGTVFYPGTYSWRTLSDANEEKGIHVIEVNEDRYESTFITTEQCCRPIKAYCINEGDSDHIVLDKNCNNYIVLKGSSDWVKKISKKYKNKAKIKSIITDRLNNDIDKQKITSISDFLRYYYKSNVPKDELLKYVEQL